MKRNMAQWMDAVLADPHKKAMPILSFPGIQITKDTVRDLVTDSNKMAACMQAVADRFDTGISVSLMDLSVEAEAFGCSVRYSDDEVPTIHDPLVTSAQEAEALAVPAAGAGRTGQCIEAVKTAVSRIADRPVFAGIIGPYSLAGRLIGMTDIMIACYEEPEMVETVLRKGTDFLITYAGKLKEAGTNGMVVAEPAAGLLSPSLIEAFSNPYVKALIDSVQDDSFLVIYHNCGNVTPLLQQIKSIGAKAYSFGNAIRLKDALEGIPSSSMVLGNLDPAGIIRSGSPETVRRETLAMLEECASFKNFVPSSGCDIPPASPLENIEAFLAAVRQFYQ